MKRKMKLQIGTDCTMTVLLLILMAKQLTGETAHEWLGAGMFVLWVFHHVLNRKWYGRIAKGKYSPFRLVQFVVNACLFAAMLGTMVSGVILSRRGFAFLPLSGGVAFARPLHIFCAFWGFVLMALHLGLHWGMVVGLVRKIAGPVLRKPAKLALCAAGIAIAVYGGYAFWKNGIGSYLFLFSSFVFFDFERPAFLFFTEYLAILGLFVWLGHDAAKRAADDECAQHTAEKHCKQHGAAERIIQGKAGGTLRWAVRPLCPCQALALPGA